MTRFGYTLMTEQSGPKDLVRYAVAAEKAGLGLLQDQVTVSVTRPEWPVSS
ncbi:F420-dependent glucose-6-phosphate dehydrogenase [Mycobacteroides abscessus subsp. abscessus]|nr:F420-dependent glucose-6-phosphate dehydrogenase [Mycobacteroides abscessus subsp. abscessus]SHR62863.1 F420-dependent glucose-6-phosphate dehydrogenase [Mycobacteroides abscessus subsp. abscessus]SHS04288.1 F420-dependent glucose-6-phosphate dehydrogenase [Mycobacteroides abscessus subsp. abscessus]SHS09188.1 F420-dependent glucose-6-phosphate dehydrogenase [Mycobacteroides abscessus subsp. abscessus]SHS13650.1 F420-dependent glucose-6-phosphate dehydrogenase [Mycobacteroides abscessus subs